EGLKLLQEARIDPGGMIRFFEALAAVDRQPARLLKYLSTHPSPVDRIERLKALAAGAPSPKDPPLPDGDWDDVKRICEGLGPARPPRWRRASRRRAPAGCRSARSRPPVGPALAPALRDRERRRQDLAVVRGGDGGRRVVGHRLRRDKEAGGLLPRRDG